MEMMCENVHILDTVALLRNTNSPKDSKTNSVTSERREQAVVYDGGT